MKLVYKPFGLIFGILGGMAAGAVFKRVWRGVRDEESTPKPTDAGRGWGEVLAAAAVQGAVFGAVKAAVDRAGASGFAAVTGVWPGKENAPESR